MENDIKNLLSNFELPDNVREVFEKFDYSLDTILMDAYIPFNITTKNNVGKFFYNILTQMNYNKRLITSITKELLEECYDFIINNPEIRVIHLPICGIIYDKFHRRTYSVETRLASNCYDVQMDKLLLYGIEVVGGKLCYRYAVDKNGIIVDYEYI